MFNKRKLAIFMTAAMLTVVAVVGIASAETGTKKPMDKNDLQTQFISKLAVNLGIGEDKLISSIETAKKQVLEEAVKSGRLTQEQADRMTVQKGYPGFFEGHKGRRGGMIGWDGQEAAKILGITQEQLRTELQSGKTWEQIITGHGLTMDQFKQKMLTRKKETLKKAVIEGKISQEKADRMIKTMEQRIADFPGPGFRQGSGPAVPPQPKQ